MPISRDIIDRTLTSRLGERALQVSEMLIKAGFDTWWVGGGVRDMLRGQLPKDIDIATSALPEDVIALFPKCDEIGKPFGSIVVSHKGATFEVTTFREDDAASDGRHPESVCFGKREEDAKRRDFTVNAIYWNPVDGALFDPYHGEQDLQERLIRFIGDPETRIRHDALRMLRAIRFRALIDGQYHPETFQALRSLAAGAAELSGVRIATEMEKMLLGPHPERALEDLWETEILHVTIPELAACKGIPQPADYHHEGDVWNHTLQCAASFTEDHGADTRWAAVFHDVGKVKTFALKERIRFDHHAEASEEIIRTVFARLKFPKSRIDKIAWIAGHHMMMGSFAAMPPERKAHWYFHPWFTELLQVMWLDIAGTDPADFTLYEEIVADYNHFLDARPQPPKALLSGDEIMRILGIGPGELVGKAVQALADAQVRKEITTKKEAKEFLQNL
ncbi:MAG: CCA tRNA nucleotidyltransferase [Patescibacteria group bacterium]